MYYSAARQVMAVARQRRARARGLAYINSLKNKPCVDCGNSFPSVCMDFDHLPGTVKIRNVSMMLTCSRHTIDAEVAKCDLVCANCHRVRTATRARGPT